MSHQLKLDRASPHLACLDAKVREWTERKPYRYITKIDRKSDKKLVKIRLLKPPPAAFRLIIGDCLHNLRSALDSLVYELALAHNSIDRLPEDRAKLLGFPIFVNRTLDVWECRNKIGCIPSERAGSYQGVAAIQQREGVYV
jgi:hypothetical protein